MDSQSLVSYFRDHLDSQTMRSVGAEVETQFVYQGTTEPITTDTSQDIFQSLLTRNWRLSTKKNQLITSITDNNGNNLAYELGRHNLELSTAATSPYFVLSRTQECLNQLYEAASKAGCTPYFSPVLAQDIDLLVIPDERDATWLQLDGREALSPLARTSSVQFTVSLSLNDAIPVLNRLGRNVSLFLTNYPQDLVWKRYIQESKANYLPSRYGGPLIFANLTNYCELLAKHDPIVNGRLVPFSSVTTLDIPLYIRSIWWHFRLKRYSQSLCVEVRPSPRLSDADIPLQFERIINLIAGVNKTPLRPEPGLWGH